MLGQGGPAGFGSCPATPSDIQRHWRGAMEEEPIPEAQHVDEKVLKRRQANTDKRECMGDVAFTEEKAAARKRQRAAVKAQQRAAEVQQPQPSPADVAGQLSKLAELYSQGLLDADEFKVAKARVLARCTDK